MFNTNHDQDDEDDGYDDDHDAPARRAGHHAQYNIAIIIIMMIIDGESFKKKVAFHFLRALRMYTYFLLCPDHWYKVAKCQQVNIKKNF